MKRRKEKEKKKRREKDSINRGRKVGDEKKKTDRGVENEGWDEGGSGGDMRKREKETTKRTNMIGGFL